MKNVYEKYRNSKHSSPSNDWKINKHLLMTNEKLNYDRIFPLDKGSNYLCINATKANNKYGSYETLQNLSELGFEMGQQKFLEFYSNETESKFKNYE